MGQGVSLKTTLDKSDKDGRLDVSFGITDLTMKQQQSFQGNHFVVHISKNDRPMNTSKTAYYPYDVILASDYVYAPFNREELKGLADFIYSILENDKNQSA